MKIKQIQSVKKDVIKVTNIGNHIKSEYDFRQVYGKRIDGVMNVFYNGVWMEESKCKEIFPFQQLINKGNENIDKTTNWIN